MILATEALCDFVSSLFKASLSIASKLKNYNS